MIKALVFMALSVGITSFASGSKPSFVCPTILAKFFSGNSSMAPHIQYLNLIRHMAFEKNIIDGVEVKRISELKEPSSELNLINTHPIDLQVYRSALVKLVMVHHDDLLLHWSELKNELKKLSEVLMRSSLDRTDASLHTKPIWAPVVLREFEKFGQPEYYFQPEEFPVFTAFKKRTAYFIDVSRSIVRLFSHHQTDPPATGFMKLRDGNTVIAYNNGQGKLIIEEGVSGKIVDTLPLSEVIPAYDHLTRKAVSELKMQEERDGSLTIFVKTATSEIYHGYNTRSRQPFHVAPIERSVIPTIIGGRIIADNKKNQTSHLTIQELRVQKWETLVDSDVNMEGMFLGAYSVNHLESGRIIYTAHGSDEFVVFDIDNPVPYRIKLPQGTLVTGTANIVELSDGKIKLLAEFKVLPGEEKEMALVDLNSDIEKIKIPGFAEDVQLPSFKVLRLKDGRNFLIGLKIKWALDTHASQFVIVDLQTKDVSYLNISSFKVNSTAGVKELEDGRVIAFVETVVGGNRHPKFVQIYGPVP